MIKISEASTIQSRDSKKHLMFCFEGCELAKSESKFHDFKEPKTDCKASRTFRSFLAHSLFNAELRQQVAALYLLFRNWFCFNYLSLCLLRLHMEIRAAGLAVIACRYFC